MILSYNSFNTSGDNTINFSSNVNYGLCKGSKDYQIVNLSAIPKKPDGKFIWRDSVGCVIPYIAGDFSGDIKILDYRYDKAKETSMILVECDTGIKWISPLLLRKPNIGVLVGKTKKDFIFDIGEKIKVGQNTFIIIDRRKDNRKRYLLECSNCHEVSWKTENALLSCNDNQKLCSVCSNFKYKKGFNDIPTIAAWMIPYFQNGIEEAEKHMPFENSEIVPICPYCNKISDRPYRISIIYRDHGFNCICKNVGSYGENLVCEVLKQNNINFLRDRPLEWSMKKRYDFIIKDKKIIIEVDGEMGHGNIRSGKSEDLVLKEIANDELKTKMAEEHGYKVIRLIYLSKNKNALLNEIKNKLPEYLWEKTDWNLAFKNIFQSNKREICEEYEQSEKERKDIMSLAIKNDCCENTIRNILRLGDMNGWCSYPKKKG